MSRTTFYHATLCLHGPLVVTKDEEHGDIKAAVVFRDKQFPLNVKRKLAALLEDKPPEGDQGVILWPRTDKERLLGNGTQLTLYKSVGELGREPGLHAPASSSRSIKRTRYSSFSSTPTKSRASLRRPFRLPLVANLEQLEGLPELASGLEVWGS